jgi:hypothetical protein
MNEIYPLWVAAHGVMIITPVNWYHAPGPRPPSEFQRLRLLGVFPMRGTRVGIAAVGTDKPIHHGL